ncbi:MAG: flagellar basal body rod C-terminal domain-containing protein [Vulcanimicrobiaceae bacterium]
MDAIKLMASAMRAAMTRLTVAASNLSNVSSTGFTPRLARATLTGEGITTATELDRRAGPLKRTGRSFDLAATGGAFAVRDPRTGVPEWSRSAAFERNSRGELVDERGRLLLGEHGPIRVAADASFDERGVVHAAGAVVGRVRLQPGTTLVAGFLGAANVDPIREMIAVLDAQRAFETAQKTLVAVDSVRAKDANELGRVKS